MKGELILQVLTFLFPQGIPLMQVFENEDPQKVWTPGEVHDKVVKLGIKEDYFDSVYVKDEPSLPPPDDEED